MSDLPANPFGLTLPLRIVQLEESVKVMDSSDWVADYIYVSDDRERRLQTKRLSAAESVEAAKVIARALKDAIECGSSAWLAKALSALTGLPLA